MMSYLHFQHVISKISGYLRDSGTVQPDSGWLAAMKAPLTQLINYVVPLCSALLKNRILTIACSRSFKFGLPRTDQNNRN